MTASAVPSGAPGYDDKDEFGNFIAHGSPLVYEGCAAYTRPRPKVKPQHLVRRYRTTCPICDDVFATLGRFSTPPVPGRNQTSSFQVERDLPGKISRLI